MKEKQYSVAILGVGARGANVYGRLLTQFPERFRIVALCDVRTQRLEAFGKEFGVDESNRFTDEDEFFKEKRSDALVIATQDQDHVPMCIKALELGYDILLEKPITSSEEELYQLLEAYNKYNRKVIVCHVLRYAPAYLKMKSLIDEGEIGKLVCIDWIEQVTYWHQSHSFVRGNT